jgi:hypothetical protein
MLSLVLILAQTPVFAQETEPPAVEETEAPAEAVEEVEAPAEAVEETEAPAEAAEETEAPAEAVEEVEEKTDAVGADIQYLIENAEEVEEALEVGIEIMEVVVETLESLGNVGDQVGKLLSDLEKAESWLLREYLGTRTPGQHYNARVSANGLSDFPVDAEGNTVAGDPDSMLILRSRLRMAWTERSKSGLLVGVELDALTGPLGTSTWGVPTSTDERQRNQSMNLARDAVSMRKLTVGNQSKDASWEVGLTTSNWGLGMVANDGTKDPLFGNSEFGDRVLRARYTLTPFGGENESFLPVYLTAAFDQVIADDMAQIWEGQWANQAILSAYMGRGKVFGTGLYTAFRHQRELEAKRVTNAGIADWYVHVPIPVADGVVLTFGLEAASIFGRTNRSTSYNAHDGLWIASSGLAFESRLLLLESDQTLHFRGGWASADANPDDAWSKDFSFDRNYGVGMVLFDEFMGAIEAATHGLLTNPEYSGSPPDGVEALTTEGAFRRGNYIQGAHIWQPQGVLKGLITKIGGMVARSNVDITQPFYTFRAGGSSRSHHNLPTTGSAMGTELDWGLGFSHPCKVGTVHAKVEGGHLWLSPDLAGDGPSRVDRIVLTGTLGF